MKYLSVTTVLNPFIDFSMVRPDVLTAASDRGTKVHHICLKVYAAGIPALSIPEDCKPYVESFKQWFDEWVDVVAGIEAEFIDKTFGIVGHIDLICRLIDGRIVIVDLKTPAVESPTWKAQLAAYRYLVNLYYEKNRLTYRISAANGCMSLRLKRNGRPAAATPYQYSNDDFAAFMSALNAYRYFKS